MVRGQRGGTERQTLRKGEEEKCLDRGGRIIIEFEERGSGKVK